MAFAEAEQWWETWQLRILVLSSLFLQFFLFVTGALRKRRTPPWFRFLTWVAYLGSDALAIYALATLFNRRKKQELGSPTERGSTVRLEVLWAPILLLHLGGQDSITAYSIQDNELWRRHFLTAASQIVVAIYVFRRSWSGGDKRLLQASILVFIPGILKCLEKPWALKKATMTSIASTWGTRVDEYEDDDTVETISSLEGFVQEATSFVCAKDAGGKKKVTPPGHRVKGKPFHLFADLAYPYSVRLRNLKYMWQRRDKAHDRVQAGLSQTFDRLYTKYKGFYGAALRGVLVLVTFVAIRRFHQSRREAYDGADVKVTYILLCCTAALELISAATMASFLMMSKRLPWPDQVAQCNLIEYYLARSEKHRGLTRLASLLRCERYLDRLRYAARSRSPSSRRITELVHDHVTGGWTAETGDRTRITNAATYREFSDRCGRWTLRKHECDGKALDSSMRRPFDERLVLWHLATDLCFFDHVDHAGSEATRCCREMSNYMAYLLLANPEMLMPGARCRIFRVVAYGELKDMLKEEPLEDEEQDYKPREKKMPLKSKDDIARKIIQKLTKCTKGSGIVHEAWAMAQELMEFGKVEGEEKMWTVIQGVWVEMLCFSASRCRGYLHAKSLGTGGEYLSYVWLLLSYMGMETLPQRMQRTDELQEEGDLGAIVPAFAAAEAVTV